MSHLKKILLFSILLAGLVYGFVYVVDPYGKVGHDWLSLGKVSSRVFKFQLIEQQSREGESFDLVILDLTVPGGLGGKETLKELLGIDPQVKALVSSGYTNDPVMTNYRKYGFSGVMPKPYTKDQMIRALMKIFGDGQ